MVVGNEAADHTRAIAKDYGAEVVTLPRGEFTYPRSMNLAMQAASHDAVFLTVAHTNSRMCKHYMLEDVNFACPYMIYSPGLYCSLCVGVFNY